MDHKICESLIDDYIVDRLTGRELDDFIKHIESCPACYEELSINYSLVNALKQIDQGKDFSEDFEIELDEKINRYKQKKKNMTSILVFSAVFIFLVSFSFAFVFSLFTMSDNIKYSSNKNDNIISFNIKSPEREFDPVKINIDKYNKDVINYLHDINSDNK